MRTHVLQMLAFVASAFGFAWYVLNVDKRESGSRKLDKQQKFYFAEEKKDEPQHRGAAMSRL